MKSINRLWSLVAALAFCFVLQPIAATESDTFQNGLVKTKYGILKGYSTEKGTLAWKGVPYAKPPVEDIRWKPPQDPDPWLGVRDAKESCEPCAQRYISRYWVGEDRYFGQEDCLYLDIYRPSNATRHLPVYVWIHGGSNKSGAACWEEEPDHTLMNSDGSTLAKTGNMIVVVIQYRLGTLGWFTHPAFRDGADLIEASGNFGNLDHIKALEWIKDNISRFGGNPRSITVGGESAGATNTMNLIMSPLAKGLFHRSIVESPGSMSREVSEGDYLAGRMLLRLLGSDYADATTQLGTMSSEDIRAYLRSKSAEEILRAQYYCGWVHSFRDGHVLPTTDWIGAIPEGDYPRIPIMIGTNEYEFKSMMPIYGPSVKTWFNVPSTSYNWLDLYRVLKGELSLSDVLATETDLGLYETIGEVRSLKWRATYCEDVVRAFKEKAPFHRVYVYRFKWDGGGDPDLEDFRFVIGAAHFTEIPFFFGSDDDAFGFSFTDANKPGRKSLQRAMMGYLSNFVWYGNPNIGPHTLWLLRNTKGLYWPSWMTCEGCPKFITFDADLNHIIIRLGNDETTPGEVAEAIADAREEYPDYLGLMDVLEVK